MSNSWNNQIPVYDIFHMKYKNICLNPNADIYKQCLLFCKEQYFLSQWQSPKFVTYIICIKNQRT